MSSEEMNDIVRFETGGADMSATANANVTVDAGNASAINCAGLVPTCTLVKWKTPEDELLNVARIAHKLALNHGYRPKRVCVAAPNNAWISQFAKACDSLEIPSVICLPVRKLTDEAKRALATVDFVANNTEENRDKLKVCGMSAEECEQMFEKCSGAKGFTLLKLSGVAGVKQFAHIMKLVVGDEDAGQLSEIIHEQLVHPCAREKSDEITITSAKDIHGEFDYVFYIGCVEGLAGVEYVANVLQGSRIVEGSESLQDSRYANATGGLNNLSASCAIGNPGNSHATSGFYISYFTRIDKQIADAAHIYYARCKDENGQQVAMCKPAKFIESEQANRPSTTSGQALLSIHGLS